MYIRTAEEALEAVAEILDLAERRDQIVRSSVKIMLCLEADPRRFMADAQALLLEGGLESLRRKRRLEVESDEPMPLVVIDPEEDRLFEAVASALDAVRLSRIVTDVFPDLVPPKGRWRVARALLQREGEFKDCLVDAIGARGREVNRGRAREKARAAVEAAAPSWESRAQDLRDLAGKVAPDGEADLLFAVVAAADDRALPLLSALDADPADAMARLGHLNDLVQAVRAHASLANC